MEECVRTEGSVTKRKASQNANYCERKKRKETIKQVSKILRKCENLRTPDEIDVLKSSSKVVKEISKRREQIKKYKEREIEKEDPLEIIEKKSQILADAIYRAHNLIVYTGAGISTSARIPDYRGSQGIWTLIQKGKDIGAHDLSLAEPTFTHMALYELNRRKILKYVVSQNCDGLHLRSGLPKHCLSEVHGNMYIEVCKNCKPNIEYWRLFDCTELTSRHYHKTNRRCHECGKPLHDTIVHFGERGSLQWPLNWQGACTYADKADVILCLGSSLKVLKRYPWLWAMDKSAKKRPRIYIVNLQWTPKDKQASLKINGKCDDVMRIVMKYLNINVTPYDRLKDPIFAHASLLSPKELHTVSQPMVKTQNEIDLEQQSNVEKIETENEIEVTENSKDTIKKENDDEEVEDDDSGDDDDEEEENDYNENEEEEEKVEEKKEIIDSSLDLVKEESLNEIKTESSILDLSNKQNSLSDISLENKKEIKEEITSSENTIKDEVNTSEESTIETKTKVFCDNSNFDLKNNLQNLIKSEIVESIEQSSNNINDLKNYLITDALTKSQQFTSYILNAAHHSSFGGYTNKFTTQYFCDNNGIRNSKEVSSHTMPTSSTAIAMNSGMEFPNFTRFENTHNLNIQTLAKTSTKYYQCLLNYYKAIENSLPQWYDVNYAYSGLHSIINPPPPEIDIWGSVIIPIVKLKSQIQAECEFCIDNYGEFSCQFYRPRKPEFKIIRKRSSGEEIVCECCNYSDDESDQNLTEAQEENNSDDVKEPTKIQAGWYGKGCRKIYKYKKKKNSY